MTTTIINRYTKGSNLKLTNFFSNYFSKFFETFGEYVNAIDGCKYLGYVGEKLEIELKSLSFCLEQSTDEVSFIGIMGMSEYIYKIILHPTKNEFSGDSADLSYYIHLMIEKDYSEHPEPKPSREDYSERIYENVSYYVDKFVLEHKWV